MTRALRRRHRIAIAVLAVALPAGVVVALAVRPVLPPRDGVGAGAGSGSSAADDGSSGDRSREVAP